MKKKRIKARPFGFNSMSRKKVLLANLKFKVFSPALHRYICNIQDISKLLPFNQNFLYMFFFLHFLFVLKWINVFCYLYFS